MLDLPWKKDVCSYWKKLQTIYKVYRKGWWKANTTRIVGVVSERLRRWTGNRLCSVDTGSKPVHSGNRVNLALCYWVSIFFRRCIGQECYLKYSIDFCETIIHREKTFNSPPALAMKLVLCYGQNPTLGISSIKAVFTLQQWSE